MTAGRGRVLLTRVVQSILLRKGISLGRAHEPHNLQSLFQRLQPKSMPVSFVRLGGDGDGGYVLPELLDGVGGLISPGVGNSWSFDKDVQARGIPCLLIDGTITRPASLDRRFVWVGKLLGARSSATTISLEDAVAGSGFQGDLILQMDVEGAEFGSILACPSELLYRFRIIVIEIHRLSEMTTRNGVEVLGAFLNCLMENHVIVHLHQNTRAGAFQVGTDEVPDVVEVTLLRRDWFVAGPWKDDPSELDHPN